MKAFTCLGVKIVCVLLGWYENCNHSNSNVKSSCKKLELLVHVFISEENILPSSSLLHFSELSPNVCFSFLMWNLIGYEWKKKKRIVSAMWKCEISLGNSSGVRKGSVLFNQEPENPSRNLCHQCNNRLKAEFRQVNFWIV